MFIVGAYEISSQGLEGDSSLLLSKNSLSTCTDEGLAAPHTSAHFDGLHTSHLHAAQATAVVPSVVLLLQSRMAIRLRFQYERVEGELTGRENVVTLEIQLLRKRRRSEILEFANSFLIPQSLTVTRD